MDCKCCDEQCNCGKQFESVAYLNKHIQRKHKTTWMCSGSNYIEGKEGEEGHWEACRKVCSKRNSLWSHFQRKHEGRYHHYCLIGDCRFGSDKVWNINMHCQKKHDIALLDEQKCLKCNQGFRQIGIYKAHIITCKMDTCPFVCNICDETFQQRATYTCHMITNSQGYQCSNWKNPPLIFLPGVFPLKNFQNKTLPGVSEINFFNQMRNPPPSWENPPHRYCDIILHCLKILKVD